MIAQIRRLYLPEVITVVEVPGGSVADDVTVGWFDKHGVLPERVSHLFHSDGHKEVFCHTVHMSHVIILKN